MNILALRRAYREAFPLPFAPTLLAANVAMLFRAPAMPRLVYDRGDTFNLALWSDGH